MKSAFCLQAVTKRYPAREKAPGFALGPLNLSLPGGCILGLIGENGAGKTTTLKMMLGLTGKAAGTSNCWAARRGMKPPGPTLGPYWMGCVFPVR